MVIPLHITLLHTQALGALKSCSTVSQQQCRDTEMKFRTFCKSHQWHTVGLVQSAVTQSLPWLCAAALACSAGLLGVHSTTAAGAGPPSHPGTSLCVCTNAAQLSLNPCIDHFAQRTDGRRSLAQKGRTVGTGAGLGHS